LLNRFLTFLRSCTTCRLAWIFVLLHAAWFFVAIANMSPPSPQFAQFLDHGGGSSASILAGRPFHFEYESILLKCLLLIDLPSLIAALPLDLFVGSMLRALRVGSFTGFYFGAGFFLLVGSFEWLILGKLTQSWLSRRGPGARVLQKLDRFSTPAMVVLGLFTLIATPIVNQRSQRLGFRHAAISFH